MTTQGSGTVAKALSLLDTFLAEGPELTLTQLANLSGMHLTTTLRLCASLNQAGLLTRDENRVYKLGPKIGQLAQVYGRTFRLEELIRPLIQDIRDRTGESVAFYVIEGDQRVCLFREHSKSVIRHHVEEGARLPLKSGVVGPVLLAFSGESGAALIRIRHAGYLIAQGREAHTTSVAVPVHDGEDKLRGALVVSGLSVRFTEGRSKSALKLLLNAARSIRASMPITT